MKDPFYGSRPPAVVVDDGTIEELTHLSFDFVTCVDRFMRKGGKEILAGPAFDDELVRFWHDRLMAEEAKELQDVINEIIMQANMRGSLDYSATPEQLVEIVDGGLDLIWTTLGLLIALGFDVNKHWAEVDRANWDKVKHLTEKDAGGKITKPAGWVAPRHLEILRGDDLR